MKKLNLLLALALLFGAKAFAQEWEWSYSEEYTSSGYFVSCELSNGKIIAQGGSNERNLYGGVSSCNPMLMMLDSNGTELAVSKYHKDGYYAYEPYVLENGSGDVYAMIAYKPDHDTCSLNYFKNFEPVTDHCILGLYKLNGDLSVAESHEVEIPIDTSEWHCEENITFPYNCGQVHLYSAFVDDDGNIVGAYSKTVTEDRITAHGYDSTVFFRMDFDGNLLARAAYSGNMRSGSMPIYLYQRYHIVKADSLYLYYGIRWDVVEENQDNLIYLDHDFNIVRSRSFKHPEQVQTFDNQDFTYHNIVRSNMGTTLLTTMLNERLGHYCCALYEYDDNVQSYGNNTPILRYVKRKSGGYDFVPQDSHVIQLEDNSLLFVYTLNVGTHWNADSRIVIEHLSPDFESLSTMYYGTFEDNHCQYATGIATTQDGGMLLTSLTHCLYDNKAINAITKFSAEAFLSIEEAHANGLKVAIVYPNPGGNEMHIRTALQDARVEVYDMNGRLVAQQPVTETETVLDATDWAAGTYIWKVVSSQTTREIESGKWVKK